MIFAHVLFPGGGAGAIASLAARTPLVVMAHGQDVANMGAIRGVEAITRRIVGRAERPDRQLALARRPAGRAVPSARPKIEIADWG